MATPKKTTPKSGLVKLKKYSPEGEELFEKEYPRLQAEKILDKHGFYPGTKDKMFEKA